MPSRSKMCIRDSFKAVYSQGNELPAENVVFLNNANNSLLGTSYIKIKAVDKNGYYDVKTLKVTTCLLYTSKMYCFMPAGSRRR